MRFIPMIFAAITLAAPVFADEFVANGKVTAVVLNPDGFQVTYTVNIDVPSGRHVIVVPNMPDFQLSYDLPGLQAVFDGPDVNLISTGLRDAGLYPVPYVETTEELAAKINLRQAISTLRDLTFRRRGLEAEAEAAQARITYLKSLSANGRSDKDAEQLTGADVSGATAAIGQEYLAALNASLAADRAVEEIADDFVPAERAVRVAQKMYDALKSEEYGYKPIVVTAGFAAPMKGELKLKVLFPYGPGWRAAYELHLDQQGAKGNLELIRRATISIDGALIDRDAKFTLSSARIVKETSTGDPNTQIGHISDRQVLRKTGSISSGSADAEYSAPLMEPVVMDERSQSGPMPVLKGQVLEFTLPNPITNEVENVVLDTLNFNVDLSAKIVAKDRETAFLIARMKNTSGGPLLPGTIQIFRDGVYIGQGELPAIGIGEEIELSFGEYDGIQVRRDLVEKVDGDVGIITSSNRRVLRYRTIITSHLDFALPVRMLDNVPVSEQEDLKITMQARPQPTEKDVKGQRGVMAWQFDLAPGTSQQIEFGYEAQWPPEKDLVIGR